MKQAAERAKELLSKMTTEEKILQLKSQLLFIHEYCQKRDYRVGHVRNVGHFMFEGENADALRPSDAARAINEDTKRSIEASPNGIPVLQNGEALHGAQCCNATCFPQAIGMAATFDDELVEKAAGIVGRELRALGVRQVFAPVINIVRDCRWGRTEESYGEDVCLSSKMGVAYTRGLESQNIIASPKHFADNYADGGRDSNYAHTSERTLREVYFEPFRACFQEGGARSVMVAYNALDGVPCSCSDWLMKDILRKEWGFKGFVISDYGGVEGVCTKHRVARDKVEAEGICLSAGLDVMLPNGYFRVAEALEKGYVTEADIDAAVYAVLKCKFELGLFEEPYVDADAADKVVRCKAHREAALTLAEKSMVLLKNKDGFLPLRKDRYKRIGLFGPSFSSINVGGYSGSHGGWKAPDAQTPEEALRDYLGGTAEIVCCGSDEGVKALAETCDLAIYFAATLEGESTDRCSLKLPNKKVAASVSQSDAVVVGAAEAKVVISQDKILKDLLASGTKVCMVLINGSPVDLSDYEDGLEAILEAWYPGEQGSVAIVKTLFGENNPGGKLPISFPKSIGQLPLYYSYKPSGRGYKYIENDGKPKYCFGYGLSYTKFAFSDFALDKSRLGEGRLGVTVTVKNTGKLEGDEVVQLYIGGKNCEVVRPFKELKAFKRVTLKPGEEKRVTLELSPRDLSFLNRKMEFGLYKCDYDIMLGNSCENILFTDTVSIG